MKLLNRGFSYNDIHSESILFETTQDLVDYLRDKTIQFLEYYEIVEVEFGKPINVHAISVIRLRAQNKITKYVNEVNR